MSTATAVKAPVTQGPGKGPVKGPALPTGTTVRAMFQECDCDPEYLNRPEMVIPLMQKAVRAVKLNDLSFAHWSFDGGGCTLAFILSESHVAMHTWPEFDRMCLIDVSVCDFRLSNRARTLALVNKFAEIFKPNKVLQEVEDMIPRLEERTPVGAAQVVEVERVLEHRRSAFQDVMVADTHLFGKTLLLDGVFQLTERYSELYQEPLVHIPLLAHAAPKRVLVCGGGDGASASHVLRHASVQSCTLVDPDDVVIEVCKRHLPELHRGALDDPRLHVHVKDATAWVQEHDAGGGLPFDAILLDTTDPGSCADTLYAVSMLEQLRDAMSDDGMFVMHVGAPMQYADDAKTLLHRAIGVFGRDAVMPYYAYVPPYGTVLVWVLCSKRARLALPDRATLSARIQERGLKDLAVVTPSTYHAHFAVPPIYAKLLTPEVRIFEGEH